MYLIGNKNDSIWGAKLNIRKILTIAVLLLSTIFYLAANCDPDSVLDPEPVPATPEPIVGTWINSANNNLPFPKTGKIVVTEETNGSMIFSYYRYVNDFDTIPVETGILTATDKWTDTQNNTWYKVEYAPGDMTAYIILKVISDGRILEMQVGMDSYPSDINPIDDSNYAIYYRQSGPSTPGGDLAYVGTWEEIESGIYKDVIILTADTFVNPSYEWDGSTWVLDFSVRGSLTISGELMTLNANEISYDGSDWVPFGPLTVTYNYSIFNNQLTFKMGTDIIGVYTKQ